jgi:PiT family inorganic phosphate transporter
VQTLLLFTVIVVALGFDFVNGFHDAANSIATVVATRVLAPGLAVAWAAFFNFVAFAIFGTKVAATIATGVVQPDVLSIAVVFAGLVGAIVWNVITAYLGLPSSSSHALVGGIAGAAVAKSGFDVLITSGLAKIGVFIVYSPLIGLALAMILVVSVSWIVHRIRRPRGVNRTFRGLQLASAAASASVTAPTTPRRPWASSSPCSSPPIASAPMPTSRCGSCCPPTLPSPSAPSSAVGASCAPWEPG